jgi:murein DD-endopeptidase MepM/ murein hydrolase activator NlpD
LKLNLFCISLIAVLCAAGCRNPSSNGSNLASSEAFIGFTVKADAQTFLKMKSTPVDSPDNKSCPLEANKSYPTEKNVSFEAGHYKVTILDEIFECPFRTGYVFAEHIKTAFPTPPGLRFPFDRDLDICDEAGGGVGAFGAYRDGGGRGHAACDLYARAGEAVRAMEDGTVISAGSYFEGTDIVDIESDSGRIISYGEVRAGSYANYGVVVGSRVKRGQVIAEVGRLLCCHPMLHLEMYSGKATGSLTAKYGGWYQRRSDLMDPTSLLKQARKNMLSGAEGR